MDNNTSKIVSSDLAMLYRVGGWAALLHLVSIVALLSAQLLGPRPTTAEEYLLIQQSSSLEALLRGDFLLLFLIGAYLGTFPALYVALKPINPVAVFFATLFTFIAVTVAFTNESSFSLLHLGKQYAAANSEVVRTQLVAAVEAIIAANSMWHSSGAYMSGFLLQGAGVIISLVMLRSRNFSKVTAIAGLLGNALDLGQHMIHPFTPDFSSIIHPIMGIFYFVWFPSLARDLFRISKTK